MVQSTTFLNHDTLIGTSNIFHSDHNLLSEFSLVFKVHLSKETGYCSEGIFFSKFEVINCYGDFKVQIPI